MIGHTALKTGFEEDIAPTFRSLPTDLFTRSHYVALASHPLWGFHWWESAPLEEAAAQWVHAVKPCAILKWKDYHEAPFLINEAVELLQKKGVVPSAIMCDPSFADDLTGRGYYTDMPHLKESLESKGIRFFLTNWLSYNEGMYVYDDTAARFYKKGKSQHYWAIPPYVVQIIRGKDALPTYEGTWFKSPSAE